MTSLADYATRSLPIVIAPEPAPTCSSDCQLWFNCTTGQWNRCDGQGAWVPVGGVGSGLHADLTDLDTSGHPGTAIIIPAGVQGNAVSIAADGSIEDAGVPPGGVGGTTNLGHNRTATNVEITSSSGQNTTIDGATNALAGFATAAHITQLEGTDAAGTPRPPLGHAASHGTGQADELTPAAIGAATAAQGALADSALQAGALLTILSSGAATSGQAPRADGAGNIAWQDFLHATSHGIGQADELTPAAIGAATAAQGALADSALQAGALLTVLSSGAATGGQAALADGAGNIAWQNLSALHADLTDLATSGHPGGVITIGGGTPGNAVVVASDGSLEDGGAPPGGGSGLHADLTDLNTSGHPGTVVIIGGGVQGNAVSIAADGSLQDSGVPPGGAGGTTDLGHNRTATNVEITSSSGQNTTIDGATNALAGFATAAHITQLEGTDAAGTPRPPLAHAASHGTGQADELTPTAIGAATAAQGALADSALQAGALLTVLSSGPATSGQAPRADGAGNIAWQDFLHATSHGIGQADELTPAAIGAATAAQGALADSALQAGALLTVLSSGAATDGQVAKADGAGNIAWQDFLHATSHGIGQADELTPAMIGALANVIDDIDPYVGGDLKVGGTNNFAVVYTDTLGIERGSSGYTDAPDSGVFLAYAPQGTYDPADGGVLAVPGALEAHGTACTVKSLQHSSSGGQQVHCSPEGVLFSVEPPAPGWEDIATDTGSYDLGTGTGPGAWVELTGTLATVQQDVGAGNRLEIQAAVTAVNKTSNRNGVIEIGFGLDGAAPTETGTSYSIVGNFSGSLPTAGWSWSTHGGLTTGQTITAWGRRLSGEHSSFGVDLVGTTDNHVLEIYVHGAGGGGSPTDISILPAPTTVTVESSTGTNGVISSAVAGGNAGILTGADKTALDSRWGPNSTIIDWGLTPQDLGTITGNTQVDLDNGHHFTAVMDGLGDWEIDFISTSNHAATQWSFTMDVAGRLPVWKFGGVLIDPVKDYDLSGSPNRIRFSFEKDFLGVSVAEMQVP